MEPKDLVIDGLDRIKENVRLCLDGLTADQLAYRPSAQANSIAWLTWHLTRTQDSNVAGMAGQPQAWLAEGWHARFDRPADPRDTGHGHTPEDVASIPASAQLLLDYHDSVYGRSVAYLEHLTAADFDRALDETRWNPPPTVGVRLVSTLADNIQHVGQMAYLRGLIEDRHWYRA